MTNNELHKRLQAIYNNLLSDQLSLGTRNLYALMTEIRPELYSLEENDSYSPEFFSLHEFEVSATADKHRLKNNIPNDVVRTNLISLIKLVLDPARRALGTPIFVSSGYRSQTLNKLVGGVPNSKHLCGLAADVSCCNNDKLFDFLNNLPHSELIYHSPHYIHVAL